MSDLSKTRIAFLGTPAFAETILHSLIEANCHITAVYTQPDKPSGRDQEFTKSPVKILAESRQIPVEQPSRLDESAIESFRKYEPDIAIVAAYGKILPEKMLGIPKFGCLNIHASLLPRWRGASPIQNTLLSGDTETGITIIKMDVGMDTGGIITEKKVSIAPLDTTETLLPKLAETGATLLLSILPDWLDGKDKTTPQDESSATLCQLIEREDGKIFWSDEAESILRRFRALQPWPGIFSFWRRNGSLIRIKFHRISIQKQNPEIKHELGQVFEIGERIGVSTGNGIILLDEIQIEGKDRISIVEFVRGYPDFIGSILE